MGGPHFRGDRRDLEPLHQHRRQPLPLRHRQITPAAASSLRRNRMNADDFEQQLERQPLRSLPLEWRKEILEKARVESPSEPSRLSSPAAPWWRELLWPCPQAWAGVLAAWLVIIGLRFTAGSESGANPP